MECAERRFGIRTRARPRTASVSRIELRLSMTDAKVRQLRSDEIPDAARTLAGAFFHDPVWGWAFEDEQRRFDQHLQLWSLYLAGGIDHGWVWVTEGV